MAKSVSHVIAIHGGAGTVNRARMTARRERDFHAALTEALEAGYAVLDGGGTSLDAVVAAVIVLEDSPLFNGAVSATGTGEHFMRAVAAYDVAAQMCYRGATLDEAASGALERVTALGGDGGLIAVDRAGNVAMPFVSEGMYRGVMSKGKASVAIY